MLLLLLLDHHLIDHCIHFNYIQLYHLLIRLRLIKLLLLHEGPKLLLNLIRLRLFICMQFHPSYFRNHFTQLFGQTLPVNVQASNTSAKTKIELCII